MKRFARDRTISPHVARKQRDARPAGDAASATLSPPAADTSRRLRTLYALVRDDEIDQVTGARPDLLDRFVRSLVDAHREQREEAIALGEDMALFAVVCGDYVIYDELCLVAILRVLPDGSLQEIRLDGAGCFVPSSLVGKGGLPG